MHYNRSWFFPPSSSCFLSLDVLHCNISVAKSNLRYCGNTFDHNGSKLLPLRIKRFELHPQNDIIPTTFSPPGLGQARMGVLVHRGVLSIFYNNTNNMFSTCNLINMWKILHVIRVHMNLSWFLIYFLVPSASYSPVHVSRQQH